jgi:hypothetical protein
VIGAAGSADHVPEVRWPAFVEGTAVVDGDASCEVVEVEPLPRCPSTDPHPATTITAASITAARLGIRIIFTQIIRRSGTAIRFPPRAGGNRTHLE